MKVIEVKVNEESIILTIEEPIQYELINGEKVGICPRVDYVEISKENLRKIIEEGIIMEWLEANMWFCYTAPLVGVIVGNVVGLLIGELVRIIID